MLFRPGYHMLGLLPRRDYRAVLVAGAVYRAIVVALRAPALDVNALALALDCALLTDAPRAVRKVRRSWEARRAAALARKVM